MWCHLPFGVPFVIAALFIFLPVTTALPLALLLGLGAFAIVRLGVTAHLRPVATGREALMGTLGDAISDLNPEGLIRVGSELWVAEAPEPIGRGTRVQVLEVRGAKVRVRAWDCPTREREELPSTR